MKTIDHFMGPHGHCEPAPPMHPHCTPCPPAPPMHPHCHPAPPMPLCHDIHDLDYARLHELVLKIYRFCTSLKERLDVLDPNGDGTGNGNGGNGCECLVDAQLDTTSTNPVQNRVVTNAMNTLTNRVSAIENSGSGTPGTGGGSNSGLKSVFKQVFTQSKTKPNRPNGGGYNFDTNTFNTPSGWSTSTDGFDNDNTTWMSYNSFLSDDTNAGWSDPIELIDYGALFDKLDKEMQDLYDKMLEDAIKRLGDVQEDAVNELINGNKTLQDAKKAIADARAEIENAQGQLEGVVGKVNKLDGKIQFLTNTDEETFQQIVMLADYLNGTDGTVTKIIADIEHLKGEIGVHATKIQAVEGRTNNVDARMSAAEATIGLHAQSIDTIGQKANQAGIDINGLKATVIQHASSIDDANNTIGEVRTELNGTTAKATTAAKWVDENKQKVNQAYTDIDGLNARVTIASTTANQAKNEASAAKLEVDALNANIDAAVERKIDDAVSTGKISITPEKITAALANNQGAAAAIVAEINKSTSQISISADKIALNGEVIAHLLGTERLVINNGASVFESDGSGYVAGGNIKWDKDGKISIGNDVITISPNGKLEDIKKPSVDKQSLSAIPDSVKHVAKRIGNNVVRYGGCIFKRANNDNPGSYGLQYSNDGGQTYHAVDPKQFGAFTHIVDGVESLYPSAYDIYSGCVTVNNGKFYVAALINSRSTTNINDSISNPNNWKIFESVNGKDWTVYKTLNLAAYNSSRIPSVNLEYTYDEDLHPEITNGNYVDVKFVRNVAYKNGNIIFEVVYYTWTFNIVSGRTYWAYYPKSIAMYVMNEQTGEAKFIYQNTIPTASLGHTSELNSAWVDYKDYIAVCSRNYMTINDPSLGPDYWQENLIKYSVGLVKPDTLKGSMSIPFQCMYLDNDVFYGVTMEDNPDGTQHYENWKSFDTTVSIL